MGSSPITGGLLYPDVLAEFENLRPSEADYAVVGKIALQHTGLEYQLESLVWTYMGDVDKGHIATRRLAILELMEMLTTLVEWTEPEDSVADGIAWAVKCFDQLRLKRNSIIHGFNFEADRKSGKLFIERRTKSLVFDSNEEYELTPQMLRNVSEEQVSLSRYLHRVDRLIKKRGLDHIGHDASPPSEPTPLPDRPPEPQTLTPLPHEAPKSARYLRRAFQESEAREKKLARKARQRADPKNRPKTKKERRPVGEGD